MTTKRGTTVLGVVGAVANIETMYSGFVAMWLYNTCTTERTSLEVSA